jgi:hypothetical protein
MEEAALEGLDRNQILGEILSLSSEELVDLLDSRSSIAGDTAFEAICRKGLEADLVVQRLMSGRIKRKSGKVRALNFLLRFGLNAPEAIPVYLHMLNDPSEDVVGTALFGLVFFQDRKQIDRIMTWKRGIPKNSKLNELAAKAISALRNSNPREFSPHFRDGLGVWQISASE